MPGFFKGFATILFCLLLWNCHKSIETKKPDANQPITVDVMIACITATNREIETSGSIVANEFAELHPEVSGRLTYLNVPEGKKVNAGTVIAKVYNADLQAQLSKAKSQYELALKTSGRLFKLLSVNGVNQADYDAALNQSNGLKSDIEYSEALIEKTIVKAPFSGELGLRQVSTGAYVTPSSIIATIQQTDVLKVDFNIPEEYGNLIHVGDVVYASVDLGSIKRFKAQVVAIEPQINASSGNLKVRALLKEGSANPGTFAKVYISAGKDKKSIVLPSETIIPEDLNKIMVVVKNNKAKFVKITTGERMPNGIEVLSGIEPGDSVIVSGILFVRPDGMVKVRGVKKMVN